MKGYIWRELSSVAEEATGTMKWGRSPCAATLPKLESVWVSKRCEFYLEKNIVYFQKGNLNLFMFLNHIEP